MKITEEQLRILRSSLGLYEGGGGKIYKNSFTNNSSSDLLDCEELVRNEMMYKSVFSSKEEYCFKVTEKGKLVALEQQDKKKFKDWYSNIGPCPKSTEAEFTENACWLAWQAALKSKL